MVLQGGGYSVNIPVRPGLLLQCMFILFVLFCLSGIDGTDLKW